VRGKEKGREEGEWRRPMLSCLSLPSAQMWLRLLRHAKQPGVVSRASARKGGRWLHAACVRPEVGEEREGRENVPPAHAFFSALLPKW